MTLNSIGAAGALAAHVTSFDQTRNHVFDVPLKDPAVKTSHYGGSYPWRIDSDTRSIVHVRNTTDEKARFTIQLNFDGGSYALPIQGLEAQQEAAIDIRQLRDGQVKDSIGRVIPREAISGQAIWHGPQALIGRIEVFSVSRGTASSLSCPGPGSCTSSDNPICDPGSQSGVVRRGKPRATSEVGLRLACGCRQPR